MRGNWKTSENNFQPEILWNVLWDGIFGVFCNKNKLHKWGVRMLFSSSLKSSSCARCQPGHKIIEGRSRDLVVQLLCCVRLFFFVKFINIIFLCVWLFATPWTAGHQASLSLTISWSLLKCMSIESVMPSNDLLCHPFSPAFNLSLHQGLFSMSWGFPSGGLSIGASASALALILPVNIQGWFPLGLNGLIPSNTTVQKHQFLGAQSLWSTLTSIHDHWKNHSFD